MRNHRLIKRSGSPRWYITWTEGRRSRRVPTGTEDHGEALKVLHLFALEHDKAPEVRPEEMPIATVLGKYYDERASKLPSAETAMIAINRLNAFYGIAPVSVIDTASNERYQIQRLAEGVTWQTINRERMVLRAGLNHSRKYHGLKLSPYVPTIREGDPDASPVEPRGRPLTIPEMAALYRSAKSEHVRLFFLVLLGTMCRPDAARDLRISGQLDFRQGVVDLNPKGRKQTKKYRPTVPMAAFIHQAFKGVKREFAIEYHGERIASTKTAWRRLRADAGLGPDVNPYSIRHTVSRELRRRRVPGEQIELMLGHRRPDRTTQIYAPYDPDYCRDAIRAIERLHADLMKEAARQTRANPAVDMIARKDGTSQRKPRRMRIRRGGGR